MSIYIQIPSEKVSDSENQAVIDRIRLNVRLSLVGLSGDCCQQMLNIQVPCIFSLFSGLLGTAFSVLKIRMELSGPGVQYVAASSMYKLNIVLIRF